MAITRLFQAGGEAAGSNSHLLEWDLSQYATTPVTYPKTGGRSFLLYNTSGKGFLQKNLPYGVRQGRIGVWCLLGNMDSAGYQPIIGLRLGTSNALFVYLNRETRVLAIAVPTLVSGIGTTVIPIFSGADDWVHIGVDFKIADSGGWAYLYLNGVLEASIDGDTLLSSYSEVDSLWLGWYDNGIEYAYLDDIYMDDTTGEAAPAVVPELRFGYIRPNGNGNSSGLTGSDGNQVDNYLLVDDDPVDDDTTYVAASATALKDTYAMETLVVPEDWAIAAVIPCHVTRKGNASVANQISTVIRSNVTEAIGSVQDLTTIYRLLWERQITDPDGDVAWTQGALDNIEIGAKSAGTF